MIDVKPDTPPVRPLGTITLSQWLAFEQAYYRLASTLSPITAETLRNTRELVPTRQAGFFRRLVSKLSDCSPAQHFNHRLWMFTIAFAVFVVFAEWGSSMLGTRTNANDFWIKGPRDFLHSLLPWAYGGLGACAYMLRSAHYFIYQRSFDVRRTPEYFNRIGLGAISGGAIILFVNNLVNDDGSSINLGSAALGFVAGYSTDLLFNTIERIVTAIFPKVSVETVAADSSMARTAPKHRTAGSASLIRRLRRTLRRLMTRAKRELGSALRRPRTVTATGPGTSSGTAPDMLLRVADRMRVRGPLLLAAAAGSARAADAPAPLLSKGGEAVDWWFAFKFNASKTFAGCGSATKEARQCIFGGQVQTKPSFGQQFAFASSKDGALAQGSGCAGATEHDPIGATFEQVYNGAFNYLIWNDQFYRDPAVSACKGDSCGAPWGHSKGMLAWNDAGDGFIMQVSTPAWPRSGSSQFDTRKVNKGNTLGCNSSNNNLRASQHFFALKLDKDGLVKVLDALRNASVVTDPDQPQIVRNGGPADIARKSRRCARGSRRERGRSSRPTSRRT